MKKGKKKESREEAGEKRERRWRKEGV